jgi:hypothetical protein
MFPNGNLRRLANHNLRKNAEVSRARKTFLKYGKIQKIPSDPDMNPNCKNGFLHGFLDAKNLQ